MERHEQRLWTGYGPLLRVRCAANVTISSTMSPSLRVDEISMSGDFPWTELLPQSTPDVYHNWNMGQQSFKGLTRQQIPQVRSGAQIQ